MVTRAILSVAALLFAWTASAGGMTAEEVFAEADTYTVRLNVAITTPFIEDEQGAYLGAGFIVDRERRWVMTNAHVAGYSPSTIEVVFADGDSASARKVYVDPYVDLAIVAVDDDLAERGLATLECEERPGTGHPIGAFGHPWGLDFTGTQGVISGRTLTWGPENLQTDTPINGGNSGGPLISMRSGRVVGIAAARMNADEDQNTNFGVPAEQACRILSLLKRGVDPSPPDLLTVFYNFQGDRGPLVVARSFLPETAVQLRTDDEILAVGDRMVRNPSDLVNALRGTLQDVQLRVRRSDRETILRGSLPPAPAVVGRQGVQFAGMLLAPAKYTDRKLLASGQDVIVHHVEPGSTANAAEMGYYDIVERVDGEQIRGLGHLREVLSRYSAGDVVTVDFLRLNQYQSPSQAYLSLRRTFEWSEPELIGNWNKPEKIARNDHLPANP